jgi:cysteine desulfurase
VPTANPSSPHAEGRAARGALDRARDLAALALGVEPPELSFTANGSESINLALLGAGRRLPSERRAVTWAAEHQAVLGAIRQLELEGHAVSVLPVDGAARVDVAGIPPDAGLVSVGLANNEVGTIQPVAEVAARAHELGALCHLDACQGPRWMRPPLELVDLASFSGHKLGAGRGGLLYAGAEVRLEPLVFGGPQEWGRRAGREDVAAALAVALALDVCRDRRDERSATLAPLAAKLRELLTELGGAPTGADPRLPNYATAAFSIARGEDLLLALDLEGVAASSGSACASGSLDPSHVLLAMGLDLESALGSLRLTLGYNTTPEDIDRVEPILRRVLGKVAANA